MSAILDKILDTSFLLSLFSNISLIEYLGLEGLVTYKYQMCGDGHVVSSYTGVICMMS